MKFVFLILLFCWKITLSVAEDASREPAACNPWIYKSWANVCLDHLRNEPQACSSYSISPNGQIELEIEKYAGKGTKSRGDIPGVPGYNEIVDFEEFIGYVVDRNTGKKTPTTFGKIHYAQDGVHIVLANPRR